MDYLQIRELYHYGVKGQKWGVRRYQNPDGSLTEEGKKRLQYFTNVLGREYEYDFNRVTSEYINKEPLPKEYVDQFKKKDYRNFNKILKALKKENISPKARLYNDKAERYLSVNFYDGNNLLKCTTNDIYRYRMNLIKVKPEKTNKEASK